MGGPGSMLVQGWPGRHGSHGRRSWSGLRSRPCGESWHEHLRGRCLVAEGRMRPDGVVMPAPALDDDLRLAKSVEDLAVEQFVPQPGIEALDIAILPRAARSDVGGLGSNAEIHSWTALAMNSGPLSERMWPGTPRRMNKSESTSMTSMALSLRATRIAKHSCVNSSMTLSIRNLRLSCVRSSTKS